MKTKYALRKIIGALAVLLLFPTLLMAQPAGIPVKLAKSYISASTVIPAGSICTASAYRAGKVVVSCLVGIVDVGLLYGVQAEVDPADVIAVYPKAAEGGID